jgi:hypothetical protein
MFFVSFLLYLFTFNSFVFTCFFFSSDLSFLLLYFFTIKFLIIQLIYILLSHLVLCISFLRNSNIDSSSGNSISIFPFFSPKPFSIIHVHLKYNPISNALCLITVLNAFEPVKYKTANAYSVGFVYKKSNRRGIEPGPILLSLNSSFFLLLKLQ